jgi:hypothetical protein
MGPYRMDLSDKCYLYVTDGKGVVVWESMFNMADILNSNANDDTANVFTNIHSIA